jgi:hypothetical protein
MRITKSYLKQVIKEEIEKLQEAVTPIGNYSLMPSRDGSQVLLQTSEPMAKNYIISGASYNADKSTRNSIYYTLDTAGQGKLSVAVTSCKNVQDLDLSKVPESVKKFVMACKKK